MKFEPVLPGYGEYLRDESQLQGRAEEICFPLTAEEIGAAFLKAGESRQKVTIQGGRTGLAGGCVPQGGLILNLSRMNGLGEIIQKEDGTAVIEAEAGVTLQQIKRQISPWVFPPDPTEETATLGGIFATGACGLGGCCYGSASSHVEKLTWVTPQGKIWEISRGAYVSRGRTLTLPDGIHVPCGEKTDLIDFLSGSEGKYGACASFTLKLQKKEQEIWGLLFFFEIQKQAGNFFRAVLRQKKELSGRILAAEFFDRGALEFLRSCRDHPLLKPMGVLPGQTAIYLELGGESEDLPEDLGRLLELFEACGGKEENSWAENHPAGVMRLRSLRHSLTAILGEMPEIRGENGTRWEVDFSCAPEELPAFAAGCQALLQKSDLSGAIYGHLLHPGIHVAFLPETLDEKQRCDRALEEICSFVLSGGGSLWGEYGRGKLHREGFSAGEVHRFLDPRNLLG